MSIELYFLQERGHYWDTGNPAPLDAPFFPTDSAAHAWAREHHIDSRDYTVDYHEVEVRI